MAKTTIIFDTATGKRIYRRLSERVAAQLVRGNVLMWCAEVAGVALVTLGAWVVHPSIALIVGGVYLAIVGNSGD